MKKPCPWYGVSKPFTPTPGTGIQSVCIVLMGGENIKTGHVASLVLWALMRKDTPMTGEEALKAVDKIRAIHTPYVYPDGDIRCRLDWTGWPCDEAVACGATEEGYPDDQSYWG